MQFKKSLCVGAAMVAATLAAPVMAQESNYKPGTVWEASRIDVLPGQFENYMDYLATTWKKNQDLAKSEGIVLDYHVLAVNNPRQGEPDLVLIVEYKDYQTTAQQEAFRKKVNAMMAMDDRKQATANGERGKMRDLMGSTEYQEMILK
ncbi:hypothetical protein [Sphingorhabdus sp.]|uniref:hypothetical protein n=1 Tax=Sphingorhabdus sp. TaxID=1902408 RepID=UPI0039832249